MDIIEYLTRNLIFEVGAIGMLEFQRSGYRVHYISRIVCSMSRFKKALSNKKEPMPA